MEQTTPPETPSPADKRQQLRSVLLIKKIRVDDGRQVFFGYCTNISSSGLFISRVNPMPLGSRFTLEITLPAPLNLTICCNCETVWQRKYSPNSPHQPGMGLRFIDLAEKLKLEIDKWVYEQQPENITTQPSMLPKSN